MKIFCFGSMSIKNLSIEVKNKIKKCIDNNFTILVGDCYGVDALVQDYLYKHNYYNVVVYHIGEKPRNNIGNFISKRINGNKQKNKDIAMCKECNYFLCFYDGKSNGSFNNITYCKSINKKGYIFISKDIKFYTSYFANIKDIPNNIYPISIANIKPKNINIKEYKKLAPSYNIVEDFKQGNITEQEYKRIYINYLSKISKYEIIKEILDMVPKNYKYPCLICYEGKNKFCHRHIVAEYLQNIINIKEI